MNLKSDENNPVIKGELLLFRTLWNNSEDNMFIVRKEKDGTYISKKLNNSLLNMTNLPLDIKEHNYTSCI